MALQDSVKSLMNPRVISVLSETPVLIAIDILLTNNFNGIPVADKSGAIIGILTKYDLIVKRASIRDDTKVGDVMNNDPLVLSENMTVEDAINAFAEHHRVDPIPVIDAERKVIGIVSRADMIMLFREYGSELRDDSSRDGGDGKGSVRRANLTWLVILGLLLAALGTAYYLDLLFWLPALPLK